MDAGYSAIVRIERNFNSLVREWYSDPDLVDAALRCIVGSQDRDGRSVYGLVAMEGRARIEFTPAERDWIAYRLERTIAGRYSPYGPRLRSSLYGDRNGSPDPNSRMITTL